MATQLKRCRNAQRIYLDFFNELNQFVATKLNSATRSQIKLRLDTVVQNYNEFLKNQGTLESIEDAEVDSTTRNSVETLYFELRPALEDKLAELLDTKTSISTKPFEDLGFNPKLPDLRIEEFHGEPTKWRAFIEAFDTHIHNNSKLSPLLKFQFLKNFVKGAGAKPFEGLAVIGDNYIEARRVLTERFDNPNVIAEDHIRSLFHVKALEKPSSLKLLELLDEVNSHLRSLKNLGRPTDYWDDLVVYIISSKFDSETKSKWRDEAPPNALPTLIDISKFITKRSRVLEGHKLDSGFSSHPSTAKQSVAPTKSYAGQSKPNFRRSQATLQVSKNVFTCLHCKNTGHTIMRCFLFLGLSTDDRLKITKELKLCQNCLRQSHQTDQCTHTDVCHICKARHHTLLHSNSSYKPSYSNAHDQSSSKRAIASPASDIKQVHSSMNAATDLPNYVFLATALVDVIDAHNTIFTVRVMLDSGSQLNFITQSLASKLGLKLSKSQFNIHGIGCSSLPATESTTIHFRSRISEFCAKIEVHVLPKICGSHPSVQFDPSKWCIPSNIKLADPKFCTPQRIDMLIGAELFFDLQSIGQIKLGKGLPILQNTQLGWVVSGSTATSVIEDRSCNLVSLSSSSERIDGLLRNFWKIEEDDSMEKISIPSENECEKHFVQNFVRNSSGRFIVRLPFCQPKLSLGDSETMARKRFLNMEKRLDRTPELRQQYNAFMTEYLQLDHMQIEDSIDPSNYYLPHHCVLKPESSSTRLRVVFDGSAKTTSGVSLNQLLLSGPVVQNELFAILLRFRSHAYAMSADIAKMYRQINIHTDDQRFQYIFWRFNSHEPLLTYRLKTVTYGTTSAPFLATRCLFQLALDSEAESPSASSIIRQDVYVDDLLTGANSLADAANLRSTVSSILLSAGMNLRKWCSNHSLILADVPEKDQEQSLQIDDQEFIKTLGLYWHANPDTLRINVNLPSKGTPKVTKRIVISEIAKIFDPIGLISPVVILGKMLMQQLWQMKLDWDEGLPMYHHTYWVNLRQEFHKLSTLTIPRHIFDRCESPTRIQVHGFADASEKAYGAAVYIRSSTPQGVCVRLYCSKSRVAPLKKLTLPRLELCAAQLLASLVSKLKLFINFTVDDYFYWSDSMIVLHWLHSESSRWQTFVANRVSNIQSLTNARDWRHVESRSNPADLVSRGQLPDQLIQSEVWWYGPPFLQFPDSTWNQRFSTVEELTVPEQRKVHQTLSASKPPCDISNLLDEFDKNSSFLQIQNVIGWVLRFINNCRFRHNQNHATFITGQEARASLQTVVRVMQLNAFPELYAGLQKPEFVVRDSSLRSLSLFMGDDKLIRVGGRLNHAMLSYSSRHPALLPYGHYFTFTLANFIHRTHLHVGPQGLLAAIRQNYWPLAGHRLVKAVYQSCITCSRAKPRLLQQKMSDLPSERVRQAFPFQYVGVDYCGPFYVHYTVRGKIPSRAYLAVFVCCTTKATHLELASNLSSASFIGALKRFIATRGICKKIISDNGTNFVGANSELHELFNLLQSVELNNDIRKLCQQDQIEWSFAPPGSPHFGGLYEAAVKSAKYHLRRMMGNANLTYEELTTLIKQVEAVLNSRPLTPLTSDDTIEALTPGHFLVGRPLTAIPEPTKLDDKINRLTRWELVKNLHKHFWSRWSHEYLHELQHRYYWAEKTANIPIGTIVIIRDDNLPPLKWRLGKVIETHPGPDGLVRVVTVKTSVGEMKRAITNLAPLPISVEPPMVQGGEDDKGTTANDGIS